jgi:hypothetical protein
MSHRKQLTRRRVVHKSIGGILPSIPEPVDPVGNAARLKSNTVALSERSRVQQLSSPRTTRRLGAATAAKRGG